MSESDVDELIDEYDNVQIVDLSNMKIVYEDDFFAIPEHNIPQLKYNLMQFIGKKQDEYTSQ